MAGTEKEDGYCDQAKELYYSDVKFKKASDWSRCFGRNEMRFWDVKLNCWVS